MKKILIILGDIMTFLLEQEVWKSSGDYRWVTMGVDEFGYERFIKQAYFKHTLLNMAEWDFVVDKYLSWVYVAVVSRQDRKTRFGDKFISDEELKYLHPVMFTGSCFRLFGFEHGDLGKLLKS